METPKWERPKNETVETSIIGDDFIWMCFLDVFLNVFFFEMVFITFGRCPSKIWPPHLRSTWGHHQGGRFPSTWRQTKNLNLLLQLVYSFVMFGLTHLFGIHFLLSFFSVFVWIHFDIHTLKSVSKIFFVFWIHFCKKAPKTSNSKTWAHHQLKIHPTKKRVSVLSLA